MSRIASMALRGSPCVRLTRQAQQRWCTGTPSKVPSYKKKVEAQENIAFKEVSNYGKLFTVKDLPPKTSQGKQYAVYEVRSKMSPHLLRVLAGVTAKWGAFPGVFTRDRITGKPKNIKFEDAVKDQRAMEDIWLMIFVKNGEETRFIEEMKVLLLETTTTHLQEVGSNSVGTYYTMHHLGSNQVEFEEGKPELAIEYEIRGAITDILQFISSQLNNEGYTSGMVTGDAQGNPTPPVVRVNIPASNEQLLQNFPAALQAQGNTALKTYREMLSSELKKHMGQ
eukprot:TRINITY_DN19730_c0_g1_i2.p1 TRINITY_DN19730_c0_g1~~TRINITY_DN19730_c0_g1_i2.p1  ORF type:complete len:304 (+),score=71.95 TRINITY_DN19730_c0_g1_i2:70-912(+)